MTLLTTATGDNYYAKWFTEYHRRRLQGVEKRVKGETLGRFWSHIGTFQRVRIPKMTRLEAEDFFSGRAGGGRLSYPMTSNYSVSIEPGLGGSFESAPAEFQNVAISLHHRHDGEPGDARPALDIAIESRRRQGRLPRRDVLAGITGWLAKERVEIRDRPVHLAAGQALLDDEDFVRQKLAQIGDLMMFSSERDPGGYGRLIRSAMRRFQTPAFLGRTILELPYNAGRSKHGKELLVRLRERALQDATPGSTNRGVALEAAVAADQLLSLDPSTHRLLIIGTTALSKEGQPIGEWDILRLDLIKGGDWRLVAVECSVTNSHKKEEEDRAKLERLRVSLYKRFSDLVEYRTRHASIDGDGNLSYYDASRGIMRT